MWAVAASAAADRMWGLDCPFRMLTGHDCPGCGTTRALVALVHGRFAAVPDHNLLLLVAPPVCVLVLLAARLRRRTTAGDAERTDGWSAAGIALAMGTLLGVWTVVRNLPSLEYLQAG